MRKVTRTVNQAITFGLNYPEGDNVAHEIRRYGSLSIPKATRINPPSKVQHRARFFAKWSRLISWPE
ncbi:hypothetical protein KAX17_15655 [Candidatus Bipolaricaulota bacterium]|nr:hypothetical protein [Candidatus Bipolaricaulota bacterium]